MSTTTTNLGLKKPSASDVIYPDVMNLMGDNADVLDTKIKALQDSVSWSTLGTTSGTATINMPSSFSEFAARTTNTSNNEVSTLHLIGAMIDGSARGFMGTNGYMNSGKYGITRYWIDRSTAKLDDMFSNGSNISANCTTTWYYRS